MAQQQEGRGTGFWILVGCGGCLAVAALGGVIGSWYLQRQVEQFTGQFTDPVQRAEQARQILGTETLPPGYHPVFGMSLGPLMSMAMLSDVPPDENGEMSDDFNSGLIYFEFMQGQQGGSNDDELEAYFRGESDDATVLQRNNVNVQSDEIIGRGLVEQDGRRLLYVSQRGRFNNSGSNNSGGTSVDFNGLMNVVMVDCNNDQRARMALWMAQDTAQGSSEPAALAGTIADEAEIVRLMGYLDVCN